MKLVREHSVDLDANVCWALLQTRDYEDKEGIKRYTTEVVAQRVQFLGSRSDGPGAGAGVPGPTDSSGGSAPAEDIPF